MSDWKSAYRSFYYATAEPPEDIHLDPRRTALLVIDIQNTYMEVDSDPVEADRWAPFRERMNSTVIPNTGKIINLCRKSGVEVIFARIACLKTDGRDRSLSQKKPGFKAISGLLHYFNPVTEWRGRNVCRRSGKRHICHATRISGNI